LTDLSDDTRTPVSQTVVLGQRPQHPTVLRLSLSNGIAACDHGSLQLPSCMTHNKGRTRRCSGLPRPAAQISCCGRKQDRQAACEQARSLDALL